MSSRPTTLANEQTSAARSGRPLPSLVDALKPWLEQLTTVSGHSPVAAAMRCGLVRALDDVRIENDTNTVERSIRPIALNRKNALFAGSDEGGANWAVIASLIEPASSMA